MSIRRKSDNETIPKRDITIADDTEKTVVVSLWNDLATDMGQRLLEMADKSPIVAIKSLKVGDFQGNTKDGVYLIRKCKNFPWWQLIYLSGDASVSLSTLNKSVVTINPDTPEAKMLKSWYDSEGRNTSLDAVGSGLSPSAKDGARSMYSDRATLAHITSNPSLGEDKVVNKVTHPFS